MKKNNFIISAVLGSTLLSTSALGAGIFLGPGTVISAPNIVLDAPVVDIDPSVQINSDNLVVNGENYTSSEDYRESQELTNFQEVSSSQYQLKENDHKSLEQYAVDLVNATPDLKDLSDEFETTKNNSNLSEQEKNQQLSSISQKIYANNSYSKVRVHPSNQELLKLKLKKIEHARDLANTNKSMTQLIKDELQELKRDISGYLVTNFKDKSINDIPEVQKSDSDLTEGLVNSSLITRGIIDDRIISVSGLSSGDNSKMNYGVWAKGVVSQGTQKSCTNTSGYKFNQTGGTIGVDMGDESIFGVAYSYLKGNIKNVDNKANKSDVETHAMSLYSKVDFTDTIFATGQAQFGVTKIKKKRSTGDIANNVAVSTPKGDTMLGKIEVGYNFAYTPTIRIIPTLGIAYTSAHVKGYSEKGDGLNRTVGDRKTSKTSGVANITAQYILETDNAKIIPELHAGVDYAFTSKNSGTEVKVIDMIDEITTPAKKLDKSFYKIGAGIKTIQSDNYEISAGYDMGFAKKFQSHTGTLKLRVNL